MPTSSPLPSTDQTDPADLLAVRVLWLCETEEVTFRPDTLYRFRVDDTCARCLTLADPHHRKAHRRP